MGNYYSEPAQLTQEEARIESEFFLFGSKVELRNSFKLVQEYFWNDDLELTNTKSTTIILKKGGHNFFIAYIEDRKQY